MCSSPFFVKNIKMADNYFQQDNPDFQPPALLRNPHLQSILASSQLRVLTKKPIVKKAEELIVDTPSGTRLLSFYSRRENSKGLIILLHGWEGSSSSAYMIDASSFFHNLGFSVIRLNLRDHGDSHHLNEGLFHGALIEETFEAVNYLTSFAQGRPCHLIGFSMGGNFALRIAARYSSLAMNNLNSVFAVSPPLDPYKTTLAIDNGYSFYRKYFLKKWKRSLMKKQKLFPHKYDFSKMLKAGTCMELTEAIMPYFPEFPSYRDYFSLYTLNSDFFQTIKIPVSVFISEDDPVIPREDFDKLESNEYLHIFRLNFGGHCGFIDMFPMRCWYNKVISDMIAM